MYRIYIKHGAILFLLIVSFTLGTFFAKHIIAQTAESNEVITQVGNPAPVTTSTEGLQTILQCAEDVTKTLKIGSDGLHNVKPAEPGVYYWCTYLVVECYNKAGFGGLTRASHASVFGMRRFFVNTAGFRYLDYRTNDKKQMISDASPGFAYFMQSVFDKHTGREHVAIIKSISVDAAGKGTIETYDSNSTRPVQKYPILNWIIQGTPYPVVGFGAPEGQTVTLGATNFQDELAKLPGTVSASIIFPGGQRVERGSTQQVPAASVIKLWIAAAVFESAENGNISLTDTHTISAADQAPGTGPLREAKNLGRTLTISELIEHMLMYSDNSATNILLSKIGGFGIVNDYASRNGYGSTRVQRRLGYPDAANENYTSANDAAAFMENLFAGRIVNQNVSQALQQILQNRTQNESRQFLYILRSLPSGNNFIGKSGLGTKVRNDTGSFTTKNGERVIISVFLSNLSNDSSGEEAIARLAQKVYNVTP